MRHLLLVCAALGLACNDGNPAAPTDPMAALAGSWTLQSWELREVDNPSTRRDMIAAGFGGYLDVTATGDFTMILWFQDRSPSEQTGTLTIRGDTLVYHTVDGDALIKYVSVGGTMTWDTLQPEAIDIDDDPVPESVVEHMVFKRR